MAFWKSLLVMLCAVMFVSCLLYAQEPEGIPMYVKTGGKLPQLAWSNGTDRLGSAKMGYIDTGIVLAVADTVGGLYKVRLSAGRHAFLDKSLANPVALVNRPGVVTAESWRIKGGSTGDTMSIALGRRVPYQTWMEPDPSRIVIELYGVQANTNWITQLRSMHAIKYADYRQVEDDVVRVYVYLSHPQPYGYRLYYRGNQLMLAVRKPPLRSHLRGKTIAIDAGHGGTNTGARGLQSGILEKEYTLLFAKALQKELLRKGCRVEMVREKDTAIDNKDRVLWAMEKNPDVFVSIHFNSAGRPEARGTSTYYKHLAFSSLSKAILHRMLRIENLPEFGHVGSFNFQPVQPTAYPSCLVEVAFLSNPEEEKMIQDEGFKKAVAKQIRRGLRDWFRKVAR